MPHARVPAPILKRNDLPDAWTLATRVGLAVTRAARSDHHDHRGARSQRGTTAT